EKGKSEVALQAHNNNAKKGKGKWNQNKGKGGFNGNQNSDSKDNQDSSNSNYNNGKDQQGDEARVAEHNDEDPVMLMVTTKEEVNCGDQWYLGSGCSTHMTGRKDWFTSFNQSQKSKVKFANDSTLAAEGVGAVCIRSKTGRQAIINDVLYIPGSNVKE
ncbi:retrovirus-related pol polyprotein from transposon TNT 1-94, partial [Trifolium medium]|nr:retrovirus-related pol polyprotein from transposon TNT 1-94 [Trifolium medium]